MKKILLPVFLTGLFLLAILGANGGQTEEWPLEKFEFMLIEGIEEEIKVRLFTSSSLGIKTYYPQDMQPVEKDYSVTFYFLSGGEVTEKAYFMFSFHPYGLDFPEEILPGTGWKMIEKKRVEEGNVQKEFLYRNHELFRAAVVKKGKIGDRIFSFVLHYAYEFGDGIYPRSKVIEDNFFLMEKGEYFINGGGKE